MKYLIYKGGSNAYDKHFEKGKIYKQKNERVKGCFIYVVDKRGNEKQVQKKWFKETNYNSSFELWSYRFFLLFTIFITSAALYAILIEDKYYHTITVIFSSLFTYYLYKKITKWNR